MKAKKGKGKKDNDLIGGKFVLTDQVLGSGAYSTVHMGRYKVRYSASRAMRLPAKPSYCSR